MVRRMATLLASLFTTSELRMWIATLRDGERMRMLLPSESSSQVGLADEAARLLHRFGAIDEALFDSLRIERPGRVAEIEAVRTELRVAPMAPAVTIVRVGRSPSHVGARQLVDFLRSIGRVRVARTLDELSADDLTLVLHVSQAPLEPLATRLTRFPDDAVMLVALDRSDPSLPEPLAARPTLGLPGELDESGIREVRRWLTPHAPSELPPRPRGLGTAPPGPQWMIGRETLAQSLLEQLGRRKAQGSLQAVAAVRGQAGIGKTALATVLVREPALWEEFPDGILWASVGSNPDPTRILFNWGRQFGAADSMVGDLASLAQRFSEIIDGRRVLWVLDDVVSVDPIRPLLRARPNRGVCLLTTRARGVTTHVDPSWICDVPVLEPHHSVALLRRLVPWLGAEHDAACHTLADRLEHLPLSLHVAAGLLRLDAEAGLDLSDTLRALITTDRWLDGATPADRAESNLMELCRRTLARLEPELRDRFVMLAHLPVSDVELDDLAALWAVEDARDTVRALVSAGLLEAVTGPRYRRHGLLHAYAHRQLGGLP